MEKNKEKRQNLKKCRKKYELKRSRKQLLKLRKSARLWKMEGKPLNWRQRSKEWQIWKKFSVKCIRNEKIWRKAAKFNKIAKNRENEKIAKKIIRIKKIADRNVKIYEIERKSIKF